MQDLIDLMPNARAHTLRMLARYGVHPSRIELDDAMQTAVSLVLARGRTFKHDGAAVSYLAKAAAGVIIRTHASREAADVMLDRIADPSDDYAAIDWRVSVERVTSTLPPKMRDAARSVLIDGYTLMEVFPRDTRARGRLRSLIHTLAGELGVTLPAGRMRNRV